MTQFNLSIPGEASLDSSVTFPPNSLVTKTHVWLFSSTGKQQSAAQGQLCVRSEWGRFGRDFPQRDVAFLVVGSGKLRTTENLVLKGDRLLHTDIQTDIFSATFIFFSSTHISGTQGVWIFCRVPSLFAFPFVFVFSFKQRHVLARSNHELFSLTAGVPGILERLPHLLSPSVFSPEQMGSAHSLARSLNLFAESAVTWKAARSITLTAYVNTEPPLPSTAADGQ